MSFSTELLIKVLVVLATAPVMALGLTLLEVKGLPGCKGDQVLFMLV